jgi:CRISPR-associated protein Csb2
MTLAITAELLHGTFRGTSYEDNGLLGDPTLETGEWPPSPARLFCALVAGDGTGELMRVTKGGELTLLEAASPPHILADPIAQAPTTHLHGRYVVAGHLAKGAAQEYPGRTASLVRPGRRRAPKIPLITYVWDDIVPSAPDLHALRLRAARIGYFGCTDSPARIRISTDAPALDPARTWEPDTSGATILPVPWPGFTAALDHAFGEWTSGVPWRRAWTPNRYCRYRAPGERSASDQPVVQWLRFETAISGRRLLAVTEALRGGVLRGCEQHVGSAAAVPAILHGHDLEVGQHVRWLGLPFVGHDHADGKIRGAAVWLPPRIDPALAEMVRVALWRLTELAGPGFHTGVGLSSDGSDTLQAHSPLRWTGPARRWVSAFPVVRERRGRLEPDIDEVANWCRHAGIDGDPVAMRWSRVPLAKGAADLAPCEVWRHTEARRPYGHLEVVFAEPVTGPIVLGRGRHFGLGLMAPRRSRADG